MTDVSFVAIASPPAIPATMNADGPLAVIAHPTAIANASVKQANSDSWMYIRE